MRKTVGVLMACAVLAGCSGGPSTIEAKDAYERWFQMVGYKDAKVIEFNLGACSKSAEQGIEGHTCQVEAHVTAGNGRYDRVQKGIFLFGEAGGQVQLLRAISSDVTGN